MLSVVGLAWFALTLLGRTPTRYEVPWAAYATAGWLVLNTVLLVAAIGRVRALRFAGERRAEPSLRDRPPRSDRRGTCEIHDLSLTGARIELRRLPTQSVHPRTRGALPSLERHVLTVPIDGREVVLKAVSRSGRRDGVQDDRRARVPARPRTRRRAQLALALFATTRPPVDRSRAAPYAEPLWVDQTAA